MIKTKVNELKVGDYISLSKDCCLMEVLSLTGFSSDKEYTHIKVKHFQSLYLERSEIKDIRLNNSKVVFRLCRDINELKRVLYSNKLPEEIKLIFYTSEDPLSSLLVPLEYIPLNFNNELIKGKSCILNRLCSEGWYATSHKIIYQGLDLLVFKHIKSYINSYYQDVIKKKPISRDIKLSLL